MSGADRYEYRNVLRRFLTRNAGAPTREVARILGHSISYIYMYADPPDDQVRHFPADRVVDVTRETGDTSLIEWLAAQCGGRFTKEAH